MAAAGVEHHVVAAAVERVARLLFFVFVGKGVDALLLGAHAAQPLLAALLGNAQRADGGGELARIGAGCLELFIQIALAPQLAQPFDAGLVGAEGDGVEPVQIGRLQGRAGCAALRRAALRASTQQAGGRAQEAHRYQA